jgi:hypothetical protein
MVREYVRHCQYQQLLRERISLDAEISDFEFDYKAYTIWRDTCRQGIKLIRGIDTDIKLEANRGKHSFDLNKMLDEKELKIFNESFHPMASIYMPPRKGKAKINAEGKLECSSHLFPAFNSIQELKEINHETRMEYTGLASMGLLTVSAMSSSNVTVAAGMLVPAIVYILLHPKMTREIEPFDRYADSLEKELFAMDELIATGK